MAHKRQSERSNTWEENGTHHATHSKDLPADKFLKDIRNDIYWNSYKRGDPSAQFITDFQLEQIWTAERFEKFVDIVCLKIGRLPIQTVMRDFMKTISILVTMHWSEWSRFGEIYLEDPESDGSFGRADHALHLLELESLEKDDFLGRDWAWHFLLYRPLFLPIIVEKGSHDIYGKQWRLPFTSQESKEDKLMGQGAYGEVTREFIARRQYLEGTTTGKYLNEKELQVAVKTFRTQLSARKETKNLKTLISSLSNHDHITTHLATIKIEDKLHILSPLADMDLEELVYNKHEFDLRYTLDHLLSELSNVAGALDYLHQGLQIPGRNVVCFHMDLKLDNILIYLSGDSPVGTWKISDFGISTLKDSGDPHSSISQQPVDPERLSAPTIGEAVRHLASTTMTVSKRPPAAFQAPEVDEKSESIVGRKSDIWSLGCILFQVLALGVGKVKLVEKLDSKRAKDADGIKGFKDDFFYRQTPGQGFEINPHVKTWLETCPSTYTGHDHHMLTNICTLILSMLSINREDRPSAGKVRDILMGIHTSTAPTESPAINQPFARILHDGTPSTLAIVTESPSPTDDIPHTQLGNEVATDSQHIHSETATKARTPSLPRPQPHGDGRQTASSPPLISERISQQPSTSSSMNHQVAIPEPRRDNTAGGTSNSPPQTESSSSPESSRAPSVIHVSSEGKDSYSLKFLPRGVLNCIISTSHDSLAFVAPEYIHLHLLYDTKTQHAIQAPKKCLWVSANLSGQYLSAFAYNKQERKRVFKLYTVSNDGRSLGVSEEIPTSSLSRFRLNEVGVSSKGHVILECEEGLRIGQLHDKLDLIHMQGNCMEIGFTAHGTWAYAWYSSEWQRHHIQFWHVADIRRSQIYQHQIIESERHVKPIERLLPFPTSPNCVLWKRHNKLCVLASYVSSSHVPRERKFSELQAVAISPDEKALIVIESKRLSTLSAPVSLVSVVPLIFSASGSCYIDDTPTMGMRLREKLPREPKCSVTVDIMQNGDFLVTVAQSNGKVEPIVVKGLKK